MVGPTGSGKTLLASTLAKILNVPFAMQDATVFVSSANNVGKYIDNMLLDLLQNADLDVKRAEQGIIYIDEVDKLARKDSKSSVGEGIQQVLLKVIEGTSVNLVLHSERIHLDTSNILFIVGGAFVGLDNIIQMRTQGSGVVIDLDQSSELIAKTIPEDLARFGMIPEFSGRLPVIVSLHGLSYEALIDVLTKPKNALCNQYIKMFALDNIELEFHEDSLKKIAELAMELGTGARALRTIMEKCMLDIMYGAPTEKTLRKIIITEDVITKKGKPIFDYYENRTEEIGLVPIPPKSSRATSAYSD
jgi:ATP-dependent Clp protease ATP-binding subunit ClpX